MGFRGDNNWDYMGFGWDSRGFGILAKFLVFQAF